MNLRLKKLMISLGIDSCELQLPGCLRTFAMGFAHSKKSRYLISDDDWMEAALACCYCHDKIEVMNHDDMKSHVLAAIAKRHEILQS